MTMILLRTAALGLLLAGGVPVMGQTLPPTPPAPAEGAMARHGGMMGKRVFVAMSEAGRRTMQDAMQAGGDRKADRETVKAARERMLTVLDSERLDTAALKRAMDGERVAANAGHEKRQAAMLAGFSRLSAADRKAFVAEARSMKTRMEARIDKRRARRGAAAEAVPPVM